MKAPRLKTSATTSELLDSLRDTTPRDPKLQTPQSPAKKHQTLKPPTLRDKLGLSVGYLISGVLYNKDPTI